MVGWLKLIVPQLAGVVCVAFLSACDPTIPFVAVCEAVSPNCVEGRWWRIDQMIGVPLETSKDGIIYSERSNDLNYPGEDEKLTTDMIRGHSTGYLYYHGIESDDEIILKSYK